VFKQLNGRNYQEILDSTFSNHPKFVKSVGFKIFYYHPNDEHNSELWETLINMENLRVIHLKRRNILRTLISRKIAEIQDQWAKTNKEIQSRNKVPKQVSISVEDLNKGFNQTRRWENDGAHKFADHPIIDVYYEDLVENKDAELRKIWEFLDVSTFEAKTPLKKQNPESLSELLTNFDEISTYFLDTEWHPFFVE
jgi:LPS sulfotransferase NodH